MNHKLLELNEDAELLSRYNENILVNHSNIETTNLLYIVTEDYLFELLVFYASVKRAWGFFPWQIHAFSPEKSTISRIKELDLPGLDAIHFSSDRESNWHTSASLKVDLIERSGIEKGIVSDLDNIFLAETPELQLLLGDYDFVFIGAPHSDWIVQTSLWSFKRSPAAIKFAKCWAEESVGRPCSDASGFPFAFRKFKGKLSALVLAKSKPADVPHHPCPYDIQANIGPFDLKREHLGYSESSMGRAKVIHFAGLRCSGNDSVESRIKVMFDAFPKCAPVFPYYLECVNEAASIMGMETVSNLDRLLSSMTARYRLKKRTRLLLRSLFVKTGFRKPA